MGNRCGTSFAFRDPSRLKSAVLVLHAQSNTHEAICSKSYPSITASKARRAAVRILYSRTQARSVPIPLPLTCFNRHLSSATDLFPHFISPGGSIGERAKLPENPLHPRWLRTDPANDRSAQPAFGVKSWGEFPKLVAKIFATKDQGPCRTRGSDRLAEPILLCTRQLHRL
jgi:hypothetical protein